MAIYEELRPKFRHWIPLLFFAFLAIYCPLRLGDRELYWRESNYAAMAQEMNYALPLTVAHGELIPSTFPMYPWIVSRFTDMGIDMELALRGISVLSLLFVTILVWEAGRRAAGVKAGIVGAAMMFSNIIIIEKAVDGYPNFLALLFLFCGWLSWFTFGAERGKWSMAWIAGLFFCGLAFYTIGWIAVLYFVFPLIFLRRPLSVIPKLRKPGFAVGVLILLGFVLMWGIPRWSVGADIPFRSNPINQALFEGYITQLILFPFELVWRFLPWSLFAWAPFCVAFHPLDKNPIFSRFLRTIFISLFFLLWLTPSTRSRDLIVLAPSLAVMTGINYWLLVRRYGHQLHFLLRILSYGVGVLSLIVILIFLMPLDLLSFVTDLNVLAGVIKHEWRMSVGFAIAAFGICAYLALSSAPKLRVYEHCLLITVSVMLLFWGVINPVVTREKYREDSKTAVGTKLRSFLGEDFRPDLIVYKDTNITGLYGVCHYMGCGVRKIHSYEELPSSAPKVYLISTEVPIFPRRYWQKLATVEYDKRKLSLWKGEAARPSPPSAD